jgi:hypothetical protein
MNSCATVGQSNTKIVEMVYSLLEMLRMSSPDEMSAKLLLMSHSPQICHEMRQYGCLPLLIQLIHQQSDDADASIGAAEDELIARQRTTGAQRELRERASKTLRNIVHNSAKSRREVRVLKLVEDLRSFVNYLRVNGSKAAANGASSAAANGDDFTDHPNSSVAYLLKVSFDEEHRRVITLLGGVYAIAEVCGYHTITSSQVLTPVSNRWTHSSGDSIRLRIPSKRAEQRRRHSSALLFDGIN